MEQMSDLHKKIQDAYKRKNYQEMRELTQRAIEIADSTIQQNQEWKAFLTKKLIGNLDEIMAADQNLWQTLDLHW